MSCKSLEALVHGQSDNMRGNQIMPQAHNNEFNAITIVSPACFCDESKDQDRARWFGCSRVASVCDGVSSSPHAAEAAELVSSLSPMLLRGDIKERLYALNDVLIARRLEAQQSTLHLSNDRSEAMQQMLLETAREHLSRSFQTTLVVASFVPSDDCVIVEVLRCGDSMFFAFSPEGELLVSSPKMDGSTNSKESIRNPYEEKIRFGPGDQLLVKIIGKASDEPQLVEKGRVPPIHADKWLICCPLDRCDNQNLRTSLVSNESHWALDKDEILLVPNFLIEEIALPANQSYGRVLYSTVIKRVEASTPTIKFNSKGTVTAVIPDHIHSQQWVHQQDRFPSDTQYVLASDGFYGSFDSASELWAWLVENEAQLRNANEKLQMMNELHTKLHSKSGDDDISFVWVYPSGWLANSSIESELTNKDTRRKECLPSLSKPG